MKDIRSQIGEDENNPLNKNICVTYVFYRYNALMSWFQISVYINNILPGFAVYDIIHVACVSLIVF